MTIRRFVRLAANGGGIASYVHGGARIGVLVDSPAATRRWPRTSRCTSPRPSRWRCRATRSPADLIAKERTIAEPKAAESGKPAEIVAKMVEGDGAEVPEGSHLLGQPFVKDDKQTVEQLLKQSKAKVDALRALRGRRRHREEAERLRRRGGGAGRRQPADAPTAPDEQAPDLDGARARRHGPAYRRILLKLSGEALMGDDTFGINRDDDRADVRRDRRGRAHLGVQVAIVIGGGNIFRGVSHRRRRHGPRDRRLHGHAGHGDERARAAGCDAPRGARGARAVGAQHRAGRRAVHPRRRRCATSRRARS